VWESIKEFYGKIITKVVEIEKLLDGKTGAEKKAVVVDYLANLVNIPYIPDFLELPAKKWALGLLIDKVVEKLNVITDWDFKDFALTTSNIEDVADIVQEPVAPLLNFLAGTPSAATINEKIEQAKTAYATLRESPEAAEAWEESINFAMKWEGGKNYTGQANGTYMMINKADKGGPTNMGIVKGTLALAHHQGVVNHNDLDMLTKEEAKLIYKRNYWDNNGWGELPLPVCLCALDCSINHGGFAWILQRAVNDLGAGIEIDGKYGPATKAALVELSKADPHKLAEQICYQRKKYYDAICAKDVNQKANLKGWYNRVQAMADVCGVPAPEGL
jgi:hypothetical protein